MLHSYLSYLSYLAIFSVSFLSKTLSLSISPNLCFYFNFHLYFTFFSFFLFPLNKFFISHLIFSNQILCNLSIVLQLLSSTSPLHSLLVVSSWFCPSILLLFSLSFPNLSFKFTLSFLKPTSLSSISLSSSITDVSIWFYWLSISMYLSFFFSTFYFSVSLISSLAFFCCSLHHTSLFVVFSSYIRPDYLVKLLSISLLWNVFVNRFHIQ